MVGSGTAGSSTITGGCSCPNIIIYLINLQLEKVKKRNFEKSGKKVKKNGQRKIKKFNMKNEVDMLNLIYSMIEEQNLGYKQMEMWKQF